MKLEVNGSENGFEVATQCLENVVDVGCDFEYDYHARTNGQYWIDEWLAVGLIVVTEEVMLDDGCENRYHKRVTCKLTELGIAKYLIKRI